MKKPSSNARQMSFMLPIGGLTRKASVAAASQPTVKFISSKDFADADDRKKTLIKQLYNNGLLKK